MRGGPRGSGLNGAVVPWLLGVRVGCLVAAMEGLDVVGTYSVGFSRVGLSGGLSGAKIGS